MRRCARAGLVPPRAGGRGRRLRLDGDVGYVLDLVGELGRIRRRDYFPPPEREEARRAVEALAARLEETAA